jgi:hypothetical protein
MTARIIHGPESESRRLYCYGHDVTHRRNKQHFGYVPSVALIAFCAGLLCGVMA